jgi:protein-S-isoprenylcysteine O-methyltransferase Ste14
MQAVLSGIVLALLSALGAFAFRFPLAYARLYPYLVWGASMAVVLVLTWQAALEYAWLTLSQYVDVGVIEAARAAKISLGAPYVGVGLGYVALMAFLWAIRRLPQFISESEETRSRNNYTRR